jgi:hypothetical protein
MGGLILERFREKIGCRLHRKWFGRKLLLGLRIGWYVGIGELGAGSGSGSDSARILRSRWWGANMRFTWRFPCLEFGSNPDRRLGFAFDRRCVL